MTISRNPKQDAALCYQCAKCSAGCPSAFAMSMPPHQVMHLLAMGREDRVRGENTVWMCAACCTCATRCPNDIDIPGLFDQVRARWQPGLKECPAPQVLSFHRSFLRDLKRRGRVHELRVMGEHNLAIRQPLHNLSLALRLFGRGRLRLVPPAHVKGFRRWVLRRSKAPRP